MTTINTPRPVHHRLLLHPNQSENRFGAYVLELLKSEGLNSFVAHDLTDGWPQFEADELAVLTRCFVSVAEADQLYAAVERGLRLVCFQPSWSLLHRFGWTSANRVLHPAWVRLSEGFPGANETLQTHVPMALYEPNEAAEYSVVAQACDADWQTNGFPAVARQKVGAGEVVFFFYDLPKAVARIRFGDPELASLLNSGHWEWTHPLDLFAGHVDERVLHLPQAELHTQFLAKLLTDICAYPLARLWYFEKAEQRAAANFSSDDDWSLPEQFEDLISTLESCDGRGTFYLMEDTHLSDEAVRAYRERGHSFGAHINSTAIKDDLPLAMPHCLREQTATFAARYGQGSLSLQCHWAPWRGYTDWVPDYMASGYRLLYPYISHPQWLNLFMCGAGRPSKFVDEFGKVFDCWQQPMQSYDDGSLIERISHDLDSVVADFEKLLRPVVERYHSVIGVGSHPVSFSTYSKPFLSAVFQLLQKAGAPIYSGDEWCRFSDRRHAVTLEYSRDENGRMQLRVGNVQGGLTLMIPAEATFTVDDAAASGVLYRRLEAEYSFVALRTENTNIEFDN
jgi:hypothetical protein